MDSTRLLRRCSSSSRVKKMCLICRAPATVLALRRARPGALPASRTTHSGRRQRWMSELLRSARLPSSLERAGPGDRGLAGEEGLQAAARWRHAIRRRVFPEVQHSVSIYSVVISQSYARAHILIHSIASITSAWLQGLPRLSHV
jgi:hypothetical protein